MPDPWCTLHLVSLCSVYFAIDVLYSGTRMKYKFHAVFSMQTCIGFQQSVNQKLQNSVPSLNKIMHWEMLQDGRGNASEGNLWSHVARRSTIILLGDMRSFLGLWRAQIESQNQIKKWYCHRPWSSHTRVIPASYSKLFKPVDAANVRHISGAHWAWDHGLGEAKVAEFDIQAQVQDHIQALSRMRKWAFFASNSTGYQATIHWFITPEYMLLCQTCHVTPSSLDGQRWDFASASRLLLLPIANTSMGLTNTATTTCFARYPEF